MNSAIKWGVLLGVAVALLGFVFGATGMYTNPAAALGFVAAAILLNVAAVAFMLFATRATAGWGAQVVNGLVLGVVAAVLIFLGSVVMTTVVFPGYYAELREGYLAYFQSMDLPQETVDAQMAAIEAATPVSSALQGAFGTLITSVVVAGIGGIFLRRK